MQHKIYIKFPAFFLSVMIWISFLIPKFSLKTNAEQDIMLNINWQDINNVGTQPSGSNSCSCYALAYCRTILDGYAHSYSEYNYYGTSQTLVNCIWTRGDYYKSGISSSITLYQHVYDSLNEGRPVIIHVYNPNKSSFNEHWVTVVGYTDVTDYNNLTEYNFLIL